MIFILAAICNNIFQTSTTPGISKYMYCIFVTTYMGRELKDKTPKINFLKFITNCVDFAFCRFSMIFTIAEICNKISNLNYPRNYDVYVLVSSLQLIRGQNRTVYTSKLSFPTLLQIALNLLFSHFR